jgi:hypothetical protein
MDTIVLTETPTVLLLPQGGHIIVESDQAEINSYFDHKTFSFFFAKHNTDKRKKIIINTISMMCPK